MLKTSSANPSHRSFLFLLNTDFTDSPACFPILLSIFVLYFLVVFFHFLFFGSVRQLYCDGLDRCILYCILFVFMIALLCFCVATVFSVNKDLYMSAFESMLK